MYPPHVKRLQISLPEEMDEALAVEAARRKTSKASLIREFVDEKLGGRSTGGDPMSALIGDIDAEAGDIDEVVYGR
jgi:hypothetical protein